MKNFSGDNIILHMCSKNHNHIWLLRYGVRQTEFLSLWTVFCPFTPPKMNPENQTFENMKKTLADIIILQMFTINDSHIWFFRYRVQQTKFFCHFGPFFALLPP